MGDKNINKIYILKKNKVKTEKEMEGNCGQNGLSHEKDHELDKCLQYMYSLYHKRLYA